MRAARCSGHLSCHECPLPCMPPCMPLPCTPPATHAPCHACPLPRTPPVDRQTSGKTLPSQTLYASGNNTSVQIGTNRWPCAIQNIFTARKQCCGKVMFIHLSVSHSVQRWGVRGHDRCLPKSWIDTVYWWHIKRVYYVLPYLFKPQVKNTAFTDRNRKYLNLSGWWNSSAKKGDGLNFPLEFFLNYTKYSKLAIEAYVGKSK